MLRGLLSTEISTDIYKLIFNYVRAKQFLYLKCIGYCNCITREIKGITSYLSKYYFWKRIDGSYADKAVKIN